MKMSCILKYKLTTPAAWAALSVRHGRISAWDQGAGDFTTHSSRVLDSGMLRLVLVGFQA